MIACFTGHRPDKLGGYGDNPLARKVKAALKEEIERAAGRGFTTFISGGAVGVDHCVRYALQKKKEVVRIDPSRL